MLANRACAWNKRDVRRVKILLPHVRMFLILFKLMKLPRHGLAGRKDVVPELKEFISRCLELAGAPTIASDSILTRIGLLKAMWCTFCRIETDPLDSAGRDGFGLNKEVVTGLRRVHGGDHREGRASANALTFDAGSGTYYFEFGELGMDTKPVVDAREILEKLEAMLNEDPPVFQMEVDGNIAHVQLHLLAGHRSNRRSTWFYAGQAPDGWQKIALDAHILAGLDDIAFPSLEVPLAEQLDLEELANLYDELGPDQFAALETLKQTKTKRRRKWP